MNRFERMTCRLRAGSVSLAAFALLVLSACGQKTDIGGPEPAAADLAAKVNGDPISVVQLNLALQKQRASRPGVTDPAASKQVLEQLIDEEIVAQKAVTAKLDKDPMVIAQLEAARRDILASRFVEAAAETAAKPPEDQILKFYDGHPAMFAQRKIYTLQQMDIDAPDARRNEVDAHIGSLKSVNDLTDWLKSQNLHFSVKQQQAAAEQLVPTILEKLATMKDGESTVIPSRAGVSALTLISSVTAPKTLADARAPIEQFLSNQSKQEVIMNLRKTLRDGAKIDYLGKYAVAASAPTNGEATSPAVSTPVNSAASAASDAAAPASQNNPAKK